MTARARTLTPGGYFVLDAVRVLLVGPRLGRELDDPLGPVERVLAPHVHVGAGYLDDVVTGPCVAAQARRRDRPRVHHEEVLEPPRVRHVLVAGEHQVDAGTLQALDRVA